MATVRLHKSTERNLVVAEQAFFAHQSHCEVNGIRAGQVTNDSAKLQAA
jgi:hypothetical protein